MNVREFPKLREHVALHLPIVVGGAIKLALSDVPQTERGEKARAAAMLSRYYWDLHAARVIELARLMRRAGVSQ